MSNSEKGSKRKRRSKALPVLGAAAGLSLSLASTASAVPGGPAAILPTSGNGDGNKVFLGEEEIADVSLATFYVFDKEDLGTHSDSNVELVRHGCHGCHGCGGCHGWHRGCGGCHHGCGCHGCGGWRWGGCGGCGCGGCGGWRWGGCGGCGGWCARVGGVAVCGR